ncbi:hypothetical protein GCM10010466_15390 [Planomonospora alba]|uniref:RNA polymerase sigma-70 region 2 domain-containing protein n=1 Tax=Planomonospora alba TaxID=161354 RepID=A0ABP6MTW1_9ACTN
MNRSYDAATVAAARYGDPRALAIIVRDHLPLVYNVVGRAMNGHHGVDDVVQETWCRRRGAGDDAAGRGGPARAGRPPRPSVPG